MVRHARELSGDAIPIRSVQVRYFPWVRVSIKDDGG